VTILASFILFFFVQATFIVLSIYLARQALAGLAIRSSRAPEVRYARRRGSGFNLFRGHQA
jgi:hypothetical protein